MPSKKFKVTLTLEDHIAEILKPYLPKGMSKAKLVEDLASQRILLLSDGWEREDDYFFAGIRLIVSNPGFKMMAQSLGQADEKERDRIIKIIFDALCKAGVVAR